MRHSLSTAFASMRGIPPLPWFVDKQVVEFDPDQSQFTARLTDLAVRFIADHRDRPFFLYVPHIMPHVPIFASERYKGSSERGLIRCSSPRGRIRTRWWRRPRKARGSSLD